MFSQTLLLSGWTLTADVLPEHLIPEARRDGFSLPGADALAAFADLLGNEEDIAEESAQAECSVSPSSPFSLPGMLPDDVSGSAALSREIDFSRLCGEHAALEIDHLCGSGSIELDEKTLHHFGAGCPSVCLDLTDAMRLGRKQMLTIRFDDAKGAGSAGSVCLKTTGSLRFEDVRITPGAGTLSAAITIHAAHAGNYAVRAACIPDSENAASPWRESIIHLDKPGKGKLSMSFSVRAPRFEPGKPYDAPMLKLELYALKSKADKRGRLSDVRTVMTGYPASAPRAYIPLTKEECRIAPDALLSRAKSANAPALLLTASASGLLYRRCTQEGVALIPCAPEGPTLCSDAANSPCAAPLKTAEMQVLRISSPATVCAQLCASPASPPLPSADTDDELLRDAAGKAVDPAAPETAEALKSLRTLALRLRAEAFRQGQYAGALCAPGEWQDETLLCAMRIALAPLHLSALPLRGAWWAQSRFSASLHVFIPEADRRGLYSVHAELVDAEGCVLAAVSKDCPGAGGAAGCIDAALPDHACVLTLRLRLLRSGALAELQEIPVYVGLRGPLEAAFA